MATIIWHDLSTSSLTYNAPDLLAAYKTSWIISHWKPIGAWFWWPSWLSLLVNSLSLFNVQLFSHRAWDLCKMYHHCYSPWTSPMFTYILHNISKKKWSSSGGFIELRFLTGFDICLVSLMFAHVPTIISTRHSQIPQRRFLPRRRSQVAIFSH